MNWVTSKIGMSDSALQLPLEGERIELSKGSIAWWPCHIGSGAEIGDNCSIGALSHVGREVVIGSNCRLQGGCYIADATIIGNNVFIGPNASILNDRYPPSGGKQFWQPVAISDGVVIGGGATVVAGVRIGEKSVLAAGATATNEIPANEVWGGVPAKYLMSREEYDARRDRNG